ncbi:hypothetical protein A6C57_00380 [Fibrella sp. ES10-3-2-2]|nr:hypothetical protein A6C57_00380 [Fibrella sp. ES10-3-2-2]
MLFLGLGETGLKTLLEQYNYKPLPDYPSVTAATNAPLPTLLPGQKGVLITITSGGVTAVYTKTQDGVKLLNEGVEQGVLIRAKKGILAKTSQDSGPGVSMADVPVDAGFAAIQVKSGEPNQAAFIEFYIDEYLVHQIGVNIDGQFVFRPWGTDTLHAFALNGFSPTLQTSNLVNLRKVVLYDLSPSLPNEHQYYGWGIQGGTLVHQIPTTGDRHLFRAGTSPSTSVNIGEIAGNGVATFPKLVIKTRYTPTGTGDTYGEVGQITYDDNYAYQKTSVGWKRSALFSTF